MIDTQPPTLRPRKAPHQARARATIEVLHAAAIQVLTLEGLVRCTTTRVAERAGVSVGSLYQYYPNRDALLAAVLETHLGRHAEAMEQACSRHHGAPVSEMARAIATTFLEVKLRDPDASKALYAIAGERGGAELVKQINTRMVMSIGAMLASASDVTFADPAVTAAVALSCLVGNVRGVFEGYAPFGFEPVLEEQLIMLLTVYLESSKVEPPVWESGAQQSPCADQTLRGH